MGVIACVIPATNPDLTPAGNAIYAIKARNAIIFSPHPMTLKTSRKTIELMREGLRRVGAPEDLVQILGYKGKINRGFSEALMTKCDLIIATGGQGVVRRAYMSGTPAYAVGAGNATMIWDETAAQDLHKAAFNTMRSKTSDFGSGLLRRRQHRHPREHLGRRAEGTGGGWRLHAVARPSRKPSGRSCGTTQRHRLPDTVALAPQAMAKAAGFEIPEDRKFLIASHGTGVYDSTLPKASGAARS